jgi:hypothetical protein
MGKISYLTNGRMLENPASIDHTCPVTRAA